jgi:glyoxylate reductase
LLKESYQPSNYYEKMKPIVSITNVFPEAGLEILRPHCELRLNDSGLPPNHEKLKLMAEISNAMITYLSDKIDANVIDVGKKLKVISNYAAGFNNVDYNHAAGKKIWVTNTPGVLHETTADLTWAMMLASARCIVPADRFTREGKFRGWEAKLFLGHDIYGKTLGIVGCGEIGQAVARRALGFGMRVLYYQRSPLDKSIERSLSLKYVSFKELVEQSDFITLHLPLNDDSRYLFGPNEFRLMKTTAVFINAARGKIVDDGALLEAVKNKEIASAALDVYENEPEIVEGLLNEESILILPHIGSASYETRDRMAILVANNVLDALDGKKPRSAVN